jgi:DNA-binding response OmpR family regulator
MKVMICESEEVLLMAIEFRLQKQGYEVTICRKDMDLAETLIAEKPNVVLFDYNASEEGEGLKPIKTIQQMHPAAGILMLSDPDEENRITEAFGMGINDFISKPFKPAELLIRVQRIAEGQEA